MTDKQLTDTLRKIQEYCREKGGLCIADCEYYVTLANGFKGCQLMELAYLLWTAPSKWDVEKIEGIIKG